MSTDLAHREGCPQDPARVETTEHAEVTTAHCLDCGAHYPPADAVPPVTGAMAPQGGTWHDGIGLFDRADSRIDPKHRDPLPSYITNEGNH